MDTKGRISVPKAFLESVPVRDGTRLFYGTLGFDGCIFLVPEEEWERLVAQVRESSIGDKSSRRFQRLFLSMARKFPVDGSGRVLIPADYRSAMKLEEDDREILLLGVDQRIELWSPKVWDAEVEETAGSYEEYAREIFRV